MSNNETGFKEHAGGRVSLLALLGVALSGNAHAATGGLLGATSTGTANISVTKSVQAQISDLSDMTLPNWSVGDAAVTLRSNVCVYSSTGNYKVTATGSGTLSAYTIASGGNTIPYSVTWNAGGAGNLADTGTSLLTGTQSISMSNAATGSATCGGGGSSNDTARVVVGITQAAMELASSSNTPYTGTLTMLVTPVLAMRTLLLILAMACLPLFGARASLLVVVTPLSDIVVPSWGIGDPMINAHIDMCVYATVNSNYAVTVSSVGGYALKNGTQSLAYGLSWDSGGVNNLGNGAAPLTNNVQLGGQSHANVVTPLCLSGPTARLNFTITQAAMTAALAGTYSGTISSRGERGMMQAGAHRFTIALAAMLMAVTPAHAAMTTIDGAPEGFEQLEAPRASAINLTYGGEALGSFRVHTTPSTVQFDDPDAVIAAVPTIKDKDAVRAVLTRPMAVNVDHLCTLKRVEDCGTLAPDVAAIIYDQNHLAAELFLSANVLVLTDSSGTRYLPLPERKFGAVHNFTGAVNGVDARMPTYALTRRDALFLRRGEFHRPGQRHQRRPALRHRGGEHRAQGLEHHRRPVPERADAAARRPRPGRRLGLHLAQDGARRPQERGQRGDRLPAAPLVRFHLPRGAALFLAHLRGRQPADRYQRAAEGAYEITLKIQEADGSAREEKRFFVKNTDLPPMGQPSYFAEAGMIRAPASDDNTIPKFSGDPMVGFGTVRRLNDSLGVSATVIGLKDRATTETGLLWVHPGVEARATALASTRGDIGFGGNVAYTNQHFTAVADARQLWLAHTPLPGYDDITNDFTQMSLTASYAVSEKLTVGVNGSYSRQQGLPTTDSIGPYAQWRAWQEGASMLTVSANSARVSGQTQGSLFLNFSIALGTSGKNGVSGTLGGGYGGQTNGPVGNARIWHDDQTPDQGLRYGAGISGDAHNRSVGGDVDWRNSLGQFSGGVQQGFGSGASTTYGGSFAVSAAQTDGALHVGGMQTETSAVMIHVGGDAKGAMKIYVNGAAQGTVDIGGSRTIYLSPFHIYHVHLVPVQPGMLDYDSADRNVTLYPGNVARLHWDVNGFQVVSARIVRADGTPLRNALLENSRADIATDGTGRIQAEIAAPKSLDFTDGAAHCRVSLPETRSVNGVLLYRAPLTCQEVIQMPINARLPVPDAVGNPAIQRKLHFRLLPGIDAHDGRRLAALGSWALLPVLEEYVRVAGVGNGKRATLRTARYEGAAALGRTITSTS